MNFVALSRSLLCPRDNASNRSMNDGCRVINLSHWSWSEPTEAQQPAKSVRLGGSRSRQILVPVLRSGNTAELPCVAIEGKNIAFDYRYADNKLDRLPALADELVRLKLTCSSRPGRLLP